MERNLNDRPGEESTSDVSSNATDIDRTPSKGKAKEESSSDWREEMESLRRHNEFLTQEREAQEIAIKDQNSQLQTALEEVATAKEKTEQERFKLQDLKADMEKFRRENQDSLNHFMRQTQQLEDEIERYRIDNAQASEIQKDLETEVKDLRAAKDALSKCMDLPADELRDDNIRLEEELRVKDLKLDEQQKESRRLHTSKDLTEKTLNDLKAAKYSADQERINMEQTIAELQANTVETGRQKRNLQREYTALEAGKASVDQENASLKSCVEDLRNTKNSLNDEKTQMTRDLSNCRLAKRNLEKALETFGNDSKVKLEQTKRALEAERSRAEREKTSLSNKITTTTDENLKLKSDLETMKSHKARADQQRNDLRSNLELANNKIRSLEHQNSDLSKNLTALSTNHLQNDRAFAALQASKARLDSEKLSLSEKVTTLNRTLESVKVQSQQATDTLRREMEEQRRQLEAKVREAAQAIGGNQTPRTVIFQKILSQARTYQNVSEIPGASRFLEICALSSLTNLCLDIPLSTEKAQQLERSIRGNEMAIVACKVCQVPKLTRTDQAPRLRVDELGQTMECCSARICKSCHLDRFVHSLLHDYWFDLGKNVWVKCPSDSCNATLNIRGKDELQATLQSLEDPNVAKNMTAYARIKTLRHALKDLRNMDDQKLKVSSALYFQLVSMGRMHNIADLPPSAVLAREDMPSFNPAEIQMINVEHQGANVEVAFPSGFTRRKRISKDCAFCVEKIYDIETDAGRIWNWIEDCSGFNGDWMWEVLKFPLKLATECNHAIDFCTECLQQHLEVQLERFGRGRCERLSCPFPECRRHLEYQEVKLYAKPETFAK
ncbi:unnamed protein product [Clonostachys rosea]|uniref:RING-type domain-containing protein n=1 Tax=Bionectria ochroleuca TaxID=29856 RepID=A0ABY6UMM1_BIOOC|nr:unnamed protein product [Clonostachys rosea]